MTPIISYIDRFPQVRALVIGDLMLDIFMYGAVDRISPEAPVPVFRFTHEKMMVGGAGNVAANLASLGCRTACIGLVGTDTEGDTIAKLLDEAGCQRMLLTQPGRPTTVKTRMIASHNHLLRADRESPPPEMESLFKQFRELVESAVADTDIVLLSDYAKGLLTDRTTALVIEMGRRFGKPVIVDPKGHDYSKYAGATLVKPNLKEFQEATGMTFDPASPDFTADVTRGARTLFRRYRIAHLIVTLSEHGMLYLTAADATPMVRIPTEAREVFDVSGAGDTSFAVLGGSLGAGATMENAMRLANLASGIVVGKLGTSCVTRDEMREQLTPTGGGPTENVVSIAEISSIAEKLRRRGKVIGFTNGCFDCMHRGHLDSFRRARAECDVLIVGVNSDRSVKGYKGPDRPIQDERTRAALVAALRYVDYVVVFDDPTAEPLIERIRPDVVAKEGYSIDQWPEAQRVLAYGGRAVILERTEGYSTSEMIARVRTMKE